MKPSSTALRLSLVAATLLALTGCPERTRNRGTDVPEHAGERINNESGKTSDEARTSKDAGRDSSANADEKPAGEPPRQ